MPVDDGSLNPEEARILDIISDNNGISQSQISDALDYNPTKVYRKVNKLKKKDLVVDQKWKGDKTRYTLAEDVTVSKNFRLETIFNYSIIAHMVELVLLAGAMVYFPPQHYPMIILVFLLAFFPSMIVSLNYLLEEDDLHEIQVSNTQNSETEPE